MTCPMVVTWRWQVFVALVCDGIVLISLYVITFGRYYPTPMVGR